MRLRNYTLYFFVAFLVLLVILSALIITSLFTTIISALILSYAFFPIYRFILRKTGRRKLSAVLVLFLIFLIVAVPMYFILKTLTSEAIGAFNSIEMGLSTGIASKCTGQTIICTFLDSIDAGVAKADFYTFIGDIARYSLSKIAKFAFVISSLALKLFLMFFLAYYFLKDGEEIIKRIKRNIPIKESLQDRILARIKETTSAVIYGAIVIALIQGVFAVIGYYIFAVPSPVLWALITAFACLFPFIGSGIIWGPLAVVKIISSLMQGSTAGVILGFGLLLYGIFVIGLIDNLLRPRLVGDKAGVHPIIILIGVFGGIYVFGTIGFIIGPLILSLTITVIEIFTEYQKKYKIKGAK